MFPIRDTIPRRHPPIAVWLIILANSLVFLFELTMPSPALERFFYLFGMVPARYAHPEWAFSVGLSVDDYWPFLTSMFLHGGWLHIIGNMWTLWIFGDNVEDRMGPVRFVVFYVLCGFAAGFVHWFTNPNSTVPTVGASGAIAGVMGAYFFLFPTSRVVVLLPIFIFPFFFEVPAVVYLGFWALSQVLSGTLSLSGPENVGGVAFWAHVGGFTAGIVLHFFFVKRSPAYRRPSRDEYELESAWVPARHWREPYDARRCAVDVFCVLRAAAGTEAAFPGGLPPKDDCKNRAPTAIPRHPPGAQAGNHEPLRFSGVSLH
jgi:membrane associated rhomboid family serine protease